MSVTKLFRLGAFFVVCLLFSLADEQLSAEHPDVLMIAVDDLRPLLGCYGDTRVKTPNIDRLAKRGVVFERAYCQYAKCGTSRLSLMTGLRPDSIGVFSNNVKDVIAFRKRKSSVSMARWLKQNGYYTQAFGKIYHDGWDSPDDWSAPSSPGRDREMWEVVDGNDVEKPTIISERWNCPAIQSPAVEDDYLFAGRMTRQVIEVLRKRSQSASELPMFLAVGYRRPHLPFVAPQRYFDLYSPDESWLAKNSTPNRNAPVMAWFNSDGYVGGAKRAGLSMPVRPSREQAVAWNGYELRSYVGVPNHGELSTETQLKLWQAYAACITYVDTQIGKLLDELERSGRLDQTVIVFWSDHGWHLGEYSAWGKMTNYEVATRVPLIVAGPSIKAGRTRTIAELVDVYPTLCELTGVPAPLHLEGEGLMSAMRDTKLRSSSRALSQYSRFRDKYMGRALRTDRYRFVLWEETDGAKVLHRELYDHRVDPMETKNLAEPENLAVESGYGDVLSKLESELRKAFQR